MKLTPENKKYIDDLSYAGLLQHWRFASVGDPWFQDETGVYWSDRMSKLRNDPNIDTVAASKSVGWDTK